MPLGPIEMLVVQFPGNQFTGEIVPALQELVDTNTVRIIDLLFVAKDADGGIGVLEMDALGDTTVTLLKPVVAEESGLLSQDDAEAFGGMLEPNSSAALLLFENTWAARFAEAVRNAKGEVLFNERIPRVVVEEVAAAIAES